MLNVLGPKEHGIFVIILKSPIQREYYLIEVSIHSLHFSPLIEKDVRCTFDLDGQVAQGNTRVLRREVISGTGDW